MKFASKEGCKLFSQELMVSSSEVPLQHGNFGCVQNFGDEFWGQNVADLGMLMGQQLGQKHRSNKTTVTSCDLPSGKIA